MTAPPTPPATAPITAPLPALPLSAPTARTESRPLSPTDTAPWPAFSHPANGSDSAESNTKAARPADCIIGDSFVELTQPAFSHPLLGLNDVIALAVFSVSSPR